MSKVRQAGNAETCDASSANQKQKNDMNNKLILNGNHIELTDALKAFVAEKTDKLFRHEERIERIRVELDDEHTKNPTARFTARGIIEIEGPDLVAAESSADMYGSIDSMVMKLDRMLRNRARQEREKRNHPHPIDLQADLPKV